MKRPAESPPAPVRQADDPGGPTTLADVDIRSELSSRPSRPPDYAGEDRALADLAKEMAENPCNMLQYRNGTMPRMT